MGTARITVCRVPGDIHARRALNTRRLAATQVDTFLETSMFDEKHLKHWKSKHEVILCVEHRNNIPPTAKRW